MTKEEAIETLLVIQKYYNDNDIDGYVGFDEEDNKALDMAIKALEQEPCEDAISRQATIDALWKALHEYEDKTEKQFIDSEELDISDWIEHRIFVQNMSDIDRQTILNMPSVKSQYTEAEIQKMQEMEQAEIEKAYELGKTEQQRVGRWVDTDEWRETVDGFEQWGYFRKCSKCGYVFKFLEIDNYCPNCGAKMEVDV